MHGKLTKPAIEYTCPFELYKDMIRTRSDDPKFKNHSLIRKESAYDFIEFDSDFIESAIDDLSKKVQLAEMGILELSPSDLLLFEFLKVYGFENAYRQIKWNNEQKTC